MDENLKVEEQTVAVNTAPTISSCAICGKTLTDPESVARGIGPECVNKLGSLGLGIQAAAADVKAAMASHYSGITHTEEPDWDKYMKLQDAFLVLAEHGIPESRMMEAIGKERGFKPPMDERFENFYWNHKRIVSRESISESGLKTLSEMGTAARSEKAAARAVERKAKAEAKAAVKAAKALQTAELRKAAGIAKAAKAEAKAKAKAEKEIAREAARKSKAELRAAEKAGQETGTGPVKGAKRGKKAAAKVGKVNPSGTVVEY